MKQHKIYRAMFAVWAALIVCAVIGFYYIYQFRQGVLQVYARQQDQYVQLVLDQINLKRDAASADEITDILTTLDSSNHKYWTLAENDSLIFVKNVQETNRYKGFTTETFFATSSGIEFLKDMKLNYVSHQTITLDGETYVVSGTVFQFQGNDYTICLMTDQDVILEENAFLSADIMLRVLLVVMALIAFVALLSLANYYVRTASEVAIREAHITELNQTVAKLNHRITRHDMFHPRWNLYQESVLDSFIEGFEKKGVDNFGFCMLAFRSEESKTDFLEDAFVYLDRKVLRFQMDADENRILLLFVNTSEQAIRRALDQFYLSEKEIKGISFFRGYDGALQAYNDFAESMRAA